MCSNNSDMVDRVVNRSPAILTAPARPIRRLWTHPAPAISGSPVPPTCATVLTLSHRRNNIPTFCRMLECYPELQAGLAIFPGLQCFQPAHQCVEQHTPNSYHL